MANKSSLAKGGVGATIAAIIAGVIAVEGGYVNDPRDPGGATNYGITENVARHSGYTGDMRHLPKEMAFNIYYEQYVLDPKFNRIIEVSPAIGEKIIDAGVNVGVRRPACWFQESLNAYSNHGKDYPKIKVDCIIGNQSINALESLRKRRGNKLACELMIKSLDSHQYAHYKSLTNLQQYMVGWVTHRIGNVPLTKCANE